jgi:hypothetical protein
MAGNRGVVYEGPGKVAVEAFVRAVVPRAPQGRGAYLLGGSSWVEPRLCLSCRRVSCCVSAPHRHVRADAGRMGHPRVRSGRWCSVYEVYA